MNTPDTEESEEYVGYVPRHTKIVRSTKLMLALLAIVLTCAVLFYPVIRKDSGGTRVTFTSISKKGPGQPTQMIGAKFHGLDKDNQPFNIDSTTATQLDDNTMGLDHPVGDITLKSGSWLSVSGNDGVFKMKEKLLDLKGSIEMFNDEGYEFRTEFMHVNVGAKTGVTKTPVDGQGPMGKLKAYGGAQIDGNRDVVDFQGPVFVTVYPAQDKNKKDTKTQETGK
jgi:lipopolysaccharide export system protein LptC